MASFMKEFEHLKIELEDIKSSTNNFDDKNVIGTGGFGKVYKGEISHSKGRSMVAFKRLDRKFDQGDPEFYKEISLLSKYIHDNLIPLLGFCTQGDEMILVYEYASGGSLDRRLKDPSLTWTKRLQICLDAAKGLNYLHDPKDTHQRVLHCDIKSGNILLGENLKVKVSDFGLSKISPANQQNSILVTSAIGTMGYCDPLYMETYTLTKESDVYSFGVVLFEVLCGRLCFGRSNGQARIFVPFWKKSYEDKKLDAIVFKDIAKQMDVSSLETFSELAYQCLNKSREGRPTMTQVVERLETALEFQVCHDVKLPKEYVTILKSAVPPLKYRSVDEVNAHLSKGIFLNEGKTWFTLNEKREHSELISMKGCLTEYILTSYSSEYNSRFAAGSYLPGYAKFDTLVKAQFLSPGITYAVNLVFKCPNRKTTTIKYKLKGETKILILYLNDKRQDEWLTAKLYQFTSDGAAVDLEIEFQEHVYRKELVIEGINLQPLEEMKVEHELLEYKEIYRAAVPPLIYKSVEELKRLLFKGVLLNGVQTAFVQPHKNQMRSGLVSSVMSFFKHSSKSTSINYRWFSLNDNEEHREMISIADCLHLDEGEESSFVYSSDYNSRFAIGSYSTRGKKFKTRVRTQFLSPGITYTVNLVFKCPHLLRQEPRKEQYIALRYTIDFEEKLSIVNLIDKRKDEWLMAKLYQFTSNQSIVDLEIEFDDQKYCNSLEIEGIEFLPVEKVELEHDDRVLEYEDILKAADPPLIFKSVEELKLILSKGVILNTGTTWLSLNDKGEHCELISMGVCLIRKVYEDLKFPGDYNSRFILGGYRGLNSQKIHVKTKFLSPLTTYAVNLVFKFGGNDCLPNQCFMKFTYKLEGEAKTWTSYLADKREDNWWTVELFQFTSDGKTVDLKFIFADPSYRFSDIVMEGIEFQPLQRVEHESLEDENSKVDMQTISDTDTFWEQKLPNDYQDIIKWSKDGVQWKTKKELYYILCNGFLINNGREWFSLDKNGKKCLMLSARAALVFESSTWQILPETRITQGRTFLGSLMSHIPWSSSSTSRFGEALVGGKASSFGIRSEIKSHLLSPRTTYAFYLIFKLPKHQSGFEEPLTVSFKDSSSDDWKVVNDCMYIYLVSPQTPVITPDGNLIACNAINRPKLKGVPRQRSDSWMEVQVWEFRTRTATKMIPLCINLSGVSRSVSLHGIIMQGIECRPV